MTKKIRLAILLSCIIAFLIISPVLVLYSMGYRFDFEKMKITLTGGIYVRTFPAADKITIDSKISGKPGVFSNAVFVQSLLPNTHSVLVKKAGYFDYSKTLPVLEKEVTKLENVLLIKQSISASIMPASASSPFSKIEKFIIKNNGLYYSSSPENAGVTAKQKLVPVIKNLLAFSTANGGITWLGLDGLLYQSDSAGKNPTKLILTPLKISKKNSYKIIENGQNIFLVENGSLLRLDQEKKAFASFNAQAKDAAFSPDAKSIIYWIGGKIHIYSFETKKRQQLFGGDQADYCQWINNDYIIFASGKKIMISEIDYRGNINIVSPLQIEGMSNMIYNSQDGKAYILTSQKTVLQTEKITP